jgi:hypothetical protein
MRRRLASLGLLVTSAAGLAAEPQPANLEGFAPAAPAQAAIQLAPEGTGGAAVDLSADTSCSTTVVRTSIIELRWNASAGPSGVQRIDISKFWDGFQNGRYESSRILPAQQSSASWEGAEPGIHYYWRVLTQAGSIWIPSITERFEAPVCPWDQAPGAHR